MLREDNISLRAIEPEDVEIIYKWENNTDIWFVSNTFNPFSKYIIKKYIETAHKDIFEAKQLRLMIDLHEKGNVVTVGTIDLFDFEPFHRRAGVGILISDIRYRKKQIATKALQLLISYAFNILHLKQLYCNITAGNTVSIRLFTNAGFVLCGEKKYWLKAKDGWEDENMYQLINKEYSYL